MSRKKEESANLYRTKEIIKLKQQKEKRIGKLNRAWGTSGIPSSRQHIHYGSPRKRRERERVREII